MDHKSIAILSTQPLIPSRYLLVTLTFLLSLLLYIDRVNISAAKEPIADSLGLTDTQFGWVVFFTIASRVAFHLGARRYSGYGG